MGCGSPRNLFYLHREWRFVLALTTIQRLQVLRPIFDSKFTTFSAEDPWGNTVYIQDVWAFFSLLLDLVLEAIANQLISGDFSTETAHQLAEQLLIRLGHGVAPVMDFYGEICGSNIFNYLIGRREGSERTKCSFKSAFEIVNDAGGKFVFETVGEYVSTKLSERNHSWKLIMGAPDHGGLHRHFRFYGSAMRDGYTTIRALRYTISPSVPKGSYVVV